MPKTVKVKGPITHDGAIPASVKARPEWGPHFSSKFGFAVGIADKIKAYVFYDSRLDGKAADRKNFLSQDQFILCRIIGGAGPEIDWRMDAEPIGTSELGFIVYNNHGKAMYAGTGTHDVNKLKLEIETLYPGITNKCKQKATVKATHTSDDGNTTVSGEYSVEYEA